MNQQTPLRPANEPAALYGGAQGSSGFLRSSNPSFTAAVDSFG